MASTPVDPLQTLQAALTVQANSKEQADLLATLRESLENHPAPIPILVKTFIGLVVNAGDSLLKRWVIDLLQFAICRSSLSLEQRTQMAAETLETLAQLLDDQNSAVVKVVIQIFTTAYPLLFRHLCINRNNQAAWNILSGCKTRIIDFLWSHTVNIGVKLCAVKFVQRIIIVQTRGGSDPRLQNKNDPNISNCPADHPFISSAKLEAEGQKLLEGIVTTLYSSQNVDVLSAILNSWAMLTRTRPAMIPVVITALKQWTPAALADQSASDVRSVEKAVRILLVHISRIPSSSQYMTQINEALGHQAVRMEKAATEEKKRKALGIVDTRKRPLSVPTEPADAKRPKLETDSGPPAPASVLASFDFTSLPSALITELIIANLEAFSESALVDLVLAFRDSRGLGPPPPPPPTGPKAVVLDRDRRAAEATPPPSSRQLTPVPGVVSTPPRKVKDEPIDPLQMDIDQDELEYEPDRLNEELSGGSIAVPMADIEPSPINLKLVDFKLLPPKDLDEEGRSQQINSSLKRIWTSGEEYKAVVDLSRAGGHTATEMWMLLIVRMITRVVEPPKPSDEEEKSLEDEQETDLDSLYARQDQLRQTLCEYIMSDFPSRVRLATTWMNEEWYNDQIRMAKNRSWRPNYDAWLNQIVASYQALMDGKDRTFSRFLLDLPNVPGDVLGLLRELCVDESRMAVGFTTLRGLVAQRPSMRTEALSVLLELTTHPEKKIRGAAINTVKVWMPHTQPMCSMIRDFALQMLRRLQVQPTSNHAIPAQSQGEQPTPIPDEGSTTILPSSTSSSGDITPDENMEDGQLPPEDLLQTPYLPERLELPANKLHVLQHVELLFALCVKSPEFLDEIFTAYGQMDVSVQEAIQELITALVRSLGSNHAKLLTLMRTCPPGSESLSLRILTIFTENGRPSGQLVALVKALVNERDLDARFLIPIIAEMDKADIMRHLPRIVAMLNGQAEPKNLVRSVFSSVVTTHSQAFGSITSNMPRVRQSELLTPAELMVLLHDSEKEIGLKSAIEAIGICFSMTDVFDSEILAVVMQQIMDKPVLPVLFLRTVIQAVTTYKSLVGFVSTTLLSRLITKKIWTNPPLWEGFIRCAKVIAPASFGALLQLPKDQLRELVDKQPSLKAGLRDYVTKKATNKARVAGFLDIFGDSEDSNTVQPGTPVA